jgi:hypothetical protein
MPIIPGVSASSDGRQPSAPTIGTASADNASASVPFTNPSYLGKPSTNNIYVALSSPGSVTASSATSPISVTGLTNGTAYTFTVTARTRNSDNSVIATSIPSSASNSVTPVAPPFFPPFFAPPFFPPSFPPTPGPDPFFPPKFSVKCISSKSKILTTAGYVNAEDIRVGDRLLTVAASNLTNTHTLKNMTISDTVEFIEVEVTTNNIDQKPLIKFNDIEDMFSPNQPIYIKTKDGIEWKNTGEISIGDMLVRIDTDSGNVSYMPVEKIENLDAGNVHEIRTTPHLWFIVGNYLVVS